MIYIDKEQQHELIKLGNSALWGVIIPLVITGKQVNNPRQMNNNFFCVIQLQVKNKIYHCLISLSI